MTQAPAPAQHARPSHLPPLTRFLKSTELDTRMLGLVGALLLIWIAFHVLSGGLFLTPPQFMESLSAVIISRYHGDGHGARHRDTQH